jgi:hypothetical protein
MTYAVLVIDMAHTGDEDGGRLIAGFAGIAEARAYAEARPRASVEELRAENQSAGDLRTLWHLYGEDCLVVGGGFSGREALDHYRAHPARAAECEWARLAPTAPAEPSVAPAKKS